MKAILGMVLAGALLGGTAQAAPAFVNGLLLSGSLGDKTGTAANGGRLGYFSDLFYDAVRQEWWALSDRGPGGGTLPYETRVERFTLAVDPKTGAISNFRIAETVKFTRDGVPFNGLAPNPKNVLGQSFDPEGFAVAPDGRFYVSDEYGPSVYVFSREGKFLRAFETPANIVPRDAAGKPNFADDKANVAGRRNNRGFEGLAITPDGKFLLAILQSAMLDEGGKAGTSNRIVKFDVTTGKAVAQYAYEMDSAEQGAGVSALLALSDHEFLVLERNNRGIGVGAELSPPVKRLYKIDTAAAQNIENLTIKSATSFQPVTKSLWLDITAGKLEGLGGHQPEKFEGLAFGPVLQDGSRLLLLGSDNDFSVTQNGSGTQFDAYFNLRAADPDASAIQCPLDQKTGCTAPDGKTPATLTAEYTLLPGVLYAFKVAKE